MADYVITDGNRFIFQNRAGKFVPTNGEAMADIFTKKQAEAIYQNSLPKVLRTVFHISKVNEDIPNTKPPNKKDIKQNTENVLETEQIRIWIEKLENINGLKDDAIKRNLELNRQLSDVDRELCDISHYIEFSNLNACQLCKAAKMIKTKRIYRRSIKNEMAVIQIILEKRIGESISDEIKENIAKLDNRTYEPRILKELFDL